MPGPRRRPLAERFWSHVDKNGPIIRPDLGPCWVWTAFCHKSGYGRIMIDRRPAGAHRVSFQLANGAIGEGMDVLHRCDHRPCVRPDHLFEGTALDNLTDMVAKRRQCKGSIHRPAEIAPTVGSRPGAAGENGYQHVLTEALVIDFCRRYRAGVSLSVLALEAGVTKDTVWKAVTGRTWKHVVLPQGAAVG